MSGTSIQENTKGQGPVLYNGSRITEEDLYLFNEGSHLQLYATLGSHPMRWEDVEGTHFAVWAPNAEGVFVMGDFNEWNKTSHPLRPRGTSGIWEGLIPGVGKGTCYKYHICSRYQGYRVEKADPLAVRSETPPRTGSIVWDLDYEWGDQEWMGKRETANPNTSPVSIYELHLGSWRRDPDEGDRHLTYREIAPHLAEYMTAMGFTHVEFLPVMEHPFYGSWGYQSLGYFSPTGRYGNPQDLMFLIDFLHQRGVGVILDWVPSHFPTDGHGLGYFDGTHLYEHSDPRQGLHPEWDTFIFNYARNEVRSFLLSSGLFWLERYHADGLRLDAVASMIYLDYGRSEGEWIPNRHGGRENLEAVSFLRRFNEEVYGRHPDVQTIAEESTSWPLVSRPTYLGGLGFGLKWDMGWMHDTLEYMSRDPIHRKFHHNKLTFRMLYAFHENFILPLSHDEVVYGKGALLRKMPGDEWQRCANLRLLFGYMYAQSAKKLLFMGGEFGQMDEWYHEKGLDWHLLQVPAHAGIQRWVMDLNRLYRSESALYERDFDPGGFAWIDCNDSQQSTLAMMRRGNEEDDVILIGCNFTPVPRHNYRIGAPATGFWREVLNSDAEHYGGSGQGNMGGVEASPLPFHGLPFSLTLTLPPLGIVFLKK
ncbi:MAG: 1,4-alpha-glucan branching protein GlgB [Deltaproteobacteria bacterium]|nr:1,4-alpha-glucan branching protein GlgB [Deltaproteobacteria bacterium]